MFKFNKKFYIIAILVIILSLISGCDNNIKFSNDTQDSIYASSYKDPETESNANSESNESTIQNEESSTTETTESSLNNSSNSSNISSSSYTLKDGTVVTPSYLKYESALPTPVYVQNGKFVVGYYAGWARYKGYYPEDIDTSKLTHINYAFAELNSDFSISASDYYTDMSNFEALRNLKRNNTKLRTLISIGGWDYSTYFSDAAATQEGRETFAQNCLNFILEHGFDGVDIDWEYPVSGGPCHHRASDKENFTLLLQAVRDKFNSQSAKDNKTYYLTTTGVPSSWYLSKIEASKISSIVDYIFIMGYDIHGSWDEYTDFNAPLYASGGAESIENGVNEYLSEGVSASKLVLGVPFYGYKYTVNSTNNNGLYSTFSSCNSISYSNIVSEFLNNSLYNLFFHETARVPYLFGNNTFISFENPSSINEKGSFAKSKNLAGVGAWELSQDSGSTLLSSLYNSIN